MAEAATTPGRLTEMRMRQIQEPPAARTNVQALLAVGLLIMLAVATAFSLNSLNEARRWVMHTDDVRFALGRVEALLRQAESSARGYAMVGDERLLAPYKQSEEMLPSSIAQLADLTSDNPHQFQPREALVKATNERMDQLRLLVATRRAAAVNGAAPSLEELRRLVLEGEQSMSGATAALDLLNTEERQLAISRRQEMRHLHVYTTIVIAASMLLLLGVARLLWMVNRDIQRRELLETMLWDERERLRESENEARAARADADVEREALARSNRDLGQFAYIASHDLKAPLRAIGNLVQWIEEDQGAQLSADSHEKLALVRARVQRMEALINGILEYSRVGSDHTPAERVEVGKLVKEVIDTIAPDGPSANGTARARFEVMPDLPAVQANRVLLYQVFQNLISNALKFANRENPIIKIAFRIQGDSYQFSVSDNGPGIAPEFHQRIWEVFQTLASRDVVEGTGVGLSVVKKIVEAQGGRAWVESAVGAGATFCFLWKRRVTVAPTIPSGHAERTSK